MRKPSQGLVLHFTLLYCALRYDTLLDYAILYSTVADDTILDWTRQYYALQKEALSPKTPCST